MGSSPLAIASLGATVLGTAVKARGQQQTAASQAASARFQAAVARNNQILADRAAADAEARGEAEGRLQEQRTRQLIGRQRAQLAANGIVVDEGSAAALTADTAEIGAMDALTIRRNAQRESLRFTQQGANFASQSQLLESQGTGAIRAGRIESFGTVLSGAGSVASKWRSFSDAGVFG